VAKHQAGEYAGYTRTRLPVELLFVEEFASRTEAFERERQIKGWSRKKKEALMRGDWAEVSRLAHPSTGCYVDVKSLTHKCSYVFSFS